MRNGLCSFICLAAFGMTLYAGHALASSGGQQFVHPGVFLDNAQIDSGKNNLAQSKDTTMRAWQALQRSGLASLDYKPTPREQVECGPFSKPDKGCTDETNDAKAAYTHALLWVYGGDSRHALKAVEIMNAWSSTLKGGHTNSNAGLQTAWSAELWPRAAEIVRYTSDVWAPADIARFETMLREQYLPDLDKISSCHVMNWQASGIEARANIAVFLNDRPAFDDALDRWRGRIRSTIYLSEDGAVPLAHPSCPKQGEALIKDWFDQRVFVDGHSQETCRDLEHTAYGLAALTNVAETARIQGVDLYSEGGARLKAAMEYHAKLKNDAVVPHWVCGGRLVGDLTGTMEVGYNHYSGRKGESLPQTEVWLKPKRPTTGFFHYLWETMTHAETATRE